MALPPANHNVARVFTTAITSTIWWFILYGAGYAFAGGSKVAHVSPLVMANLVAFSYVFIPYFATQGVLTSMLDGHIKGRILVPGGEDPNARIENFWRTGLINALKFGLVPAGIGFALSITAGAESVTPGAFASRFAWGGTLICAVVAYLVAGEPFLKLTRVPRAQRMFSGDPKQYLFSHFALPHGVANAVINGVLAFALSPVTLAEGGMVPTKNVVGDLVITFLILTWLMVSGSKTQARIEAQWGIAPEAAASEYAVPTAFLPAFFASFGFAIVMGFAFHFLGMTELSVYLWVVLRGVVFGLYTAWVSRRVAQAMLNETFHPEAAAAAAAPIAS
jgi:hypothetical protein